MTVYSDVSRVRYVANGITKEFAVPFPYLTNSDGSAQLSVYLGDSDTALVEGKDYYVEGIGSFNQEVGLNVENELDDTLKTYEERFDSGTVIFYNAPVTDQAIAILRNVPNTQGVVFINGENFPAADYANALDKLTMKVQELEEKSDRSVILPPTSKEKPIEVRENIIKAADEAKKTAEIAIELVGEAPETIRQETENAKNIITEFTDEKTATFNTLAENTQNELVSYAESKTQEFTGFVEEKTQEFEQIAITATEQAVGSAERSRIWAEGEQAEVKPLGGELSSMGAADLAYAIANAPEDTPIDASGLFAMNVVKGEKGDKGDKGDDGKDGGGLEIGDVAFAVMGIDESKNLRRYLNGQVISQSQFVSFANWVKERAKLYPNTVATEENWQAEVTNSKLGQCGKFVIDDALGTIRLPKVVNINGLQDLSLMGSIKTESLPSIKVKTTGSGDNNSMWHRNLTVDKAGLARGDGVEVGNSGSSSQVSNILTTEDNPVYQDNAPVQQEAIQYPYFIQVATGVEETVDVTREIELNNPFSLLDYKWSEYELSNASWLISNGAFHSGATYVAVYELLLKIKNGTETKDGVSVKLSTEAYEDTDFVINTTDTTFRLPIKVKLASGNAVVGNGMALGLTDGIDNFGLSLGGTAGGENYYLVNSGNAYGGDLGVRTTDWILPSQYDVSGGVTTDPTKSGIETSSNGLKLYFYVGETIQDANVINASGVLTRVADLSDEYIVGLGMPDYSAGIAVSTPVEASPFVAPCDGLYVVTGLLSNTNATLTINGTISAYTFYMGSANRCNSALSVPLSKGDICYWDRTFNGFFETSQQFYPFKGVKI